MISAIQILWVILIAACFKKILLLELSPIPKVYPILMILARIGLAYFADCRGIMSLKGDNFFALIIWLHCDRVIELGMTSMTFVRLKYSHKCLN